MRNPVSQMANSHNAAATTRGLGGKLPTSKKGERDAARTDASSRGIEKGKGRKKEETITRTSP